MAIAGVTRHRCHAVRPPPPPPGGLTGRAIPEALSPGEIGPLRLHNRTIKAATFEGRSDDGLVTDALIEFHRAVAAGGVGMTTVAYCAVAPEGRTPHDQIWMRPEVVPGLRRLTDAVHAEGAAVSAQLGHAGPAANRPDRCACTARNTCRPTSRGHAASWRGRRRAGAPGGQGMGTACRVACGEAAPVGE
ncbi:hypothetical protein ACFU9W_42430 [Streptomyces sp. NPDC057600]|uniref:oxidoreductase n=1 Tax=Streptomyces sp. NPDC057600 TaxID=3346180 RepID=UPI0036BE273A